MELSRLLICSTELIETQKRNITSGLENHDKELAEKLRASMFVFEDIVTLGSEDIQKVLRSIDQKDLAPCT